MQKDFRNPSINDPTLLRRNENANDCTTSTWQGPKKNTGPFLAIEDSENDNNLGSRGQPANSFVLIVKMGPNPLEDEQLEFSAFFKPWRLVKFFWVTTGFGCFEKNLQTTDGRTWTIHPQIQHVQSCTAWSLFITRTRVAQELEGSGLHIFVSSKAIVIHV